MAHFIKNYMLGERLAIVCRGSFPDKHQKLVCEHLLIEKNKIIFQSDGAFTLIDEITYDNLKQLCPGDIVSINNRGVCYLIFDSNEGDATIFMGGKCNSNCIMCPSTDVERQEDYTGQKEELFHYISMLPEDLRHYVITGGEPTMNPETFLEITGELAERFPEAGALLLTNGRSFSVKSFLNALLEKCPPYLEVAIPVHGSNEQIHDRITRAPGSFRQTMKGIQNLMQREISVEIRIVVTRLNCDDLVVLANLLCKEFPKIMRVNFISLEVRGNCAKNRHEVYIDPRESFEKSQKAINIIISHGIDVGLYNYPLCCVDRGYWFLCKKSITPEKVCYEKICENCDAKEYCGGMFVSTFKITHPNVKPIKFEMKEE